MIYRVVVPVPVSGGTGSVTVLSGNSKTFAYLSGKCLQGGIIPPSGTPSGSYSVLDNIGFLIVSGNFQPGMYNFGGPSGFVGDITINIVGATTNGVYLMVFILERFDRVG